MAIQNKTITQNNHLTKKIVIEERMPINERPFLPLIIKKNRNVFTDEEKLKLNSALHIRIDNFLSFFTLRRMDEEFIERFDSKISSISPSDVMLNGLDDRCIKSKIQKTFILLAHIIKQKKIYKIYYH